MNVLIQMKILIIYEINHLNHVKKLLNSGYIESETNSQMSHSFNFKLKMHQPVPVLLSVEDFPSSCLYNTQSFLVDIIFFNFIKPQSLNLSLCTLKMPVK